MQLLKFLGSIYSVRTFYPRIITEVNIEISNWNDVLNYLSSNQFLVKFVLFGIFFFIIYDVIIIAIKLLYNQFFSPFRTYSSIVNYTKSKKGEIYFSNIKEKIRVRYRPVAEQRISDKDFVIMLRTIENDFINHSSMFMVIIIQLEIENIFKIPMLCLYLLLVSISKSILKIFEELFKQVNKELNKESI